MGKGGIIGTILLPGGKGLMGISLVDLQNKTPVIIAKKPKRQIKVKRKMKAKNELTQAVLSSISKHPKYSTEVI